MRMVTHWKRIVVLCLVLLGICWAQDDPDPRARNLSLDVSSLPIQAALEREGVLYLDGGTEGPYPSLEQDFVLRTSRGPVGLSLLFAAFESRENAYRAFKRFPASIRETRFQNFLGDHTFGRYPFLSVVVQDRALYLVRLSPYVDFDTTGLDEVDGISEFLAPLCDEVTSLVEEKLVVMGYPVADDIVLQPQVISETVTASSRAEIRVFCDQSQLYPLTYSATIYRTGSDGRLDVQKSLPVVVAGDGKYAVLWDGTQEDGTFAETGEYVIEVFVEDALHRRSSITEQVLVTEEQYSSQSLPTTKDTTLRAQKPHRNEGANPRLFLSHRLEARGKSNNPLVGFSLADAELNGLTKATLVMSIQDCDLPRRWSRTGRDIEAHAVTADWVEGDGNKYRVNGGQGKTKGRGQGVTWFSPIDEKIQNNRPNGSQSWDGARSVATAPTAPPVTVMNDQTGPIEFDVTQDVLQTVNFDDGSSEISWLLKKSDEGKFGNVRFYSKEGAAQAGDPDLAPTLILEYGSPISKAETKEPSPQASQLLAKIGIKSSLAKLKTRPTGSELPSLRESLKQSAGLSRLCESTLSQLAGPNPAVKIVARTAYRSWLHQTVTLG